MGNERITENIVREHFTKHETPGQLIEEQATRDLVIAQALKKASKQGSGVGKPEFIVTHAALWPDGVILIECKADVSCHESARRKAGQRPTTADISACAVDGVLHYAEHLAKHRNVIAIAVSGEKKARRARTGASATRSSRRSRPRTRRRAASRTPTGSRRGCMARPARRTPPPSTRSRPMTPTAASPSSDPAPTHRIPPCRSPAAATRS